jgi:hypothetical protein
MKPRGVLVTALLMVVVVVAIIVAWMVWRPEASGAMPFYNSQLIEYSASFITKINVAD